MKFDNITDSPLHIKNYLKSRFYFTTEYMYFCQSYDAVDRMEMKEILTSTIDRQEYYHEKETPYSANFYYVFTTYQFIEKHK